MSFYKWFWRSSYEQLEGLLQEGGGFCALKKTKFFLTGFLAPNFVAIFRQAHCLVSFLPFFLFFALFSLMPQAAPGGPTPSRSPWTGELLFFRKRVAGRDHGP